MIQNDEYREWFVKAEEDLLTCHQLLSLQNFVARLSG